MKLAAQNSFLADKYCCARKLKEYVYFKLLLESEVVFGQQLVGVADKFLMAFLTANKPLFLKLSEQVYRMPKENFEQDSHQSLLQLLPDNVLSKLPGYASHGMVLTFCTLAQLKTQRIYVRWDYAMIANSPLQIVVNSSAHQPLCPGT